MADFRNMNHQELLNAYNAMCGLTGGTPRTSRFQSKEEAVRRCEEMQSRVPQPPPPEPQSSPRKLLRHDKVIRLVSDRNPRRDGSDAHKHFEAMRGGVTVGEYLSKFEDRDTAARWLYNTVRDGHAKLLG